MMLRTIRPFLCLALCLRLPVAVPASATVMDGLDGAGPWPSMSRPLNWPNTSLHSKYCWYPNGWRGPGWYRAASRFGPATAGAEAMAGTAGAAAAIVAAPWWFAAAPMGAARSTVAAPTVAAPGRSRRRLSRRRRCECAGGGCHEAAADAVG